MAEDLLKKFTIDVDTIKANNSKQQTPVFSQGDVKTAILIVNLTENDIPLDLSNKKVKAAFKKPDNNSVYQDETTGITISDATNGKIQIILTTQALAIKGNVRAQISITDENGGLVAETAEFTFLVRESIVNTSIISSDDLPIIEKTIEAANVLSTVDLQQIVDNTHHVNSIKEEVEIARGPEENLNARLESFSSQLAQSVTKIETIKGKNLIEAESMSVALTNKNVFSFPKLTRSTNNPLIIKSYVPTTPIQGAYYSLQFVAVFPAYKYLSNPIDKYYLYACSHDNEGCWLFTSPTPEGQWTLYSETPIINVNMLTWAKSHVSSPDVFFDEVNNKVLLYTHSPLATGDQQFTGLWTSDDGVNFIPYGSSPVLSSNGHINRWNGKSVSYVRSIKVGNAYYGVYQANGNATNQETGVVTASIGACYSNDGYHWNLFDEPLYINEPSSRGAFSPTIFYWQGFFVIVYRGDDNSLYGLISKDLKTYESIGIVFEKGTTGTYDYANVLSPTFLYDEGVLYMYYGYGGTENGIAVAKMEVQLA
jgi:hypothetical protein